jgi:hypothetical protein
MTKRAEEWVDKALNAADLMQGYIDLVIKNIELLNDKEKQEVIDLINEDKRFNGAELGVEQEAAVAIIAALVNDE